MKSKPRTDPRLPPFYWEEVILLVLSALAVAGIWWLFRDLVFPKQTPPAQIQPNLPPIAITIHIRAVAGERIVIDVREYSYDPEGETPRILGLGSPRFGVVERIDDYRFRYSAPLRNREIDSFSYQVADESGVENEGWVLVNVGAPARSRPAPLRATTDARDYPRRQPTEPQQRSTATPPKTALPPRMKVESEEHLQTTPVASTPVAVTAPGLAPIPESGAIPETATSTPRVAPMPSRELRVARQPVTMVPPPSASTSPSPLDPGSEAPKRPEIRGSMTKTDSKIKARKTAEPRKPKRAVATQKKRESNPSNPSAWSPRYHGTK